VRNKLHCGMNGSLHSGLTATSNSSAGWKLLKFNASQKPN